MAHQLTVTLQDIRTPVIELKHGCILCKLLKGLALAYIFVTFRKWLGLGTCVVIGENPSQ